jgi:hypothetical protein
MPVFAPEERNIYSLCRLSNFALRRSAMCPCIIRYVAPPERKRRLSMIKSSLTLVLMFVCVVVLLIHSRATSASSAMQSSSLCTKGEKVVFSCALKSSTKIVSLCSSPQLTKTDGYLQYRFGVPGQIELEYPKDRAKPEKSFHYNHYFRAQVDLTEISFTNNGFTYTVFNNFNGEEKLAISEEGLTVSRPNSEKDITYQCRGRAKMDFSTISDVLVNDSTDQ